MIKINPLLACLALGVAVLAPAQGEDKHDFNLRKVPAQTPYGSVETGVWDTSAGPLNFEVSPWDLNPQLLDPVILQTAYMGDVPPGEKPFPAEPESEAAADKTWLMLYLALMPSDGKIPADPSLDNMRMMARATCEYKGKDEHFRVLTYWGSARTILTNRQNGALKKRVERICSQSPARAQKAAQKLQLITTPGKGIPSRDIVDAVHDLSLTTGAGGWAQTTNTTYVLLKGGWGIRNPDIPLAVLDRKLSQDQQSDKWFRWKRDGKGYKRKKDGKWITIPGSSGVKPLKKGARLNDSYKNYSSGSAGGTSSYSSRKSLTLRRDGTYAVGSSSMMSSGLSGGSVYKAGSKGETGCSSATSISGGGIAGGSSTSDKACGDGLSGKYMIDGYTLTLNSNAGEVKHFPFYKMNDTVVIFGGKEYAREKK